MSPHPSEQAVGDVFQRIDRHILGIALFITSESIFFLVLVISYIAYRGSSVSGPGPRDALDIIYTAVFSVFLFASSATMARVSSALARGDAAGVRRWLIVTIVLGAIFLGGQLNEYARLYSENITISRNLWTSTFFTLTGFHGLHVFIGIVLMLVLTGVVAQRSNGVRAGMAVEVVSLYWHFVDAVWVVIFSVVYLWTLIS